MIRRLVGTALLALVMIAPALGSGITRASATSTPASKVSGTPTAMQLAPLKITDLLTAPVPALCTHPAGRLRNGSLPGLAPSQGYETLHVSGRGPVAVLADVTRDHSADAAVVMSCSAGGVAWPDLVMLYSAGATLRGYVDLGKVTPAERAGVKTLKIVSGNIVVTWSTTEGCCFTPKSWAATLRWNGSKVVVQSFRQTAGVVAKPAPSVVLTAGGGIVGLPSTRPSVAIAWLTKKLGTPTSRQRSMCDSAGVPGQVVYWGDFGVLISAAKGVGTLPPSRVLGWTVGYLARPTGKPKARTTAGIGVGSTAAQVTAAYPGARSVAYASGPRLVVGANHRATFIAFDLDSNGRVVSVASGYDCGD